MTLASIAAAVGVARASTSVPEVRTASKAIDDTAAAAASVVEPEAPRALAPERCAPEPPLAVQPSELPAPAELLRLVREDPAALGSASIGSPTRGSLWGGVQIPESEGIQRAGDYGWGTQNVVHSIERAVREVRRCFPNTPRLYVGDIGRKGGGWLRPHRSHQSGLDADIGYYYRTDAVWYEQVTADNLDAVRTWALIRAMVEGGNVDMIFIDRSIQKLLRAHAETLPESERRLDLFQTDKKKDTVIRHTRGHTGHFHVRFKDEAAAALGQRIAGIAPRYRTPWVAPKSGNVAPRFGKLAPKPGQAAPKWGQGAKAGKLTPKKPGSFKTSK
jgi:murein endopeptidase